MVVDNKYYFGDEVYLKTDPEQMLRMVTSFACHPNGQIIYTLSCGTTTSDHYDFEISPEVNKLIKVK